jgi:hypothetical protein
MWTTASPTLRFAHMPTGEQNQKKRTNDALPKPDNSIRYRQKMHDSLLIPDEAAPRFRDDAAPRNGMMPPPDSEMIAPPIQE